MELHGLRVGDLHRPRAARVLTESPVGGLSGTVRFDWAAMDAWFEEDEQVFVHPRSPYTRVDALRSNRPVRVELDGAVLADACSSVMVFETGLPTRYYLSRTDVDFAHLVPSDTVTACPYKGTTSGYWSVRAGGTVHPDLAWSYDFPTRQLLPIAGMIAFYNEKSTSSWTASRWRGPRPTSWAPGLTAPRPEGADLAQDQRRPLLPDRCCNAATNASSTLSRARYCSSGEMPG